jgi:hypothetical protein
MSVNRCLQAVAEAGDLSDGEVKEIIDHLEALRGDPDFRAKALEMADELAREAKQERVRQQLTLAARGRFQDYMKRAIETPPTERQAWLGVKAGKPTMADIGEGFLAESNKSFAGARDSTFWRMRAASADAYQDMVAKIAGVVGKRYGKIAQDMEMNKRVAYELAGHDSGSPTAKSLADIVRSGYDEALARQNKAGADIRKLPNYIFAQHHDAYSLAKHGFDTWYQDIAPKLDPKTWGDADPRKYLKTVYQNILQGSHDNAWQQQEFRNVSGLARRISRHRVLQFKNETQADVDGFLAYNGKYGRGTVLNNALHQVAHGHATAALMERMGPNPEAFQTWLVDQLKSKSRDADESMDGWPGREDILKRQFSVLTGQNSRVTNATIAHNFAMFRAVTNWAHLGMSTISSFGDINNQAMILHYMGMPMIQAYGHAIGTFARFMADAVTSTATLGQGGTRLGALRDPELMSHLKSLASGLDGINHANAGRWGADPDLSGKTARLTAHFFTLNGQAYWDDVVKFGTSKAIATFMADQTGKSWSDLSVGLQDGLRRAGILEGDWEKLRSTKVTRVAGHDHLLPEHVEDKELAAKYQQMLLSNSEVAVPMPGAREQARLAGLQKGNPFHEILRTMLMFKSFPLSIIGKLWPRAAEMGLPGIAMATIGSLPFGYASLALKNALVGKEPPDPMDLKTTLASFLQGGAGSLPADLVTHKFDRTHSAADFLVGPAGAELSDLLESFSAPLHEEFKSQPKWKAIRTEAIKKLSQDVPFANLWFTKMAYQNLVVNQLLELSNPGYLQRMQTAAQKNYNEKYFLPPKKL